MSSNLVLTSRLQDFVASLVNEFRGDFTSSFSLSIRKRTQYSQEIVLYPVSHYPFFVGVEVERLMRVVNSSRLTLVLKTENGVVVFIVKDYID